MEKIAIVDIIKKFVIFICLSISLINIMTIVSIFFGPYSPTLIMSITNLITMIPVLLLIALTTKYIGEIVIVVLKSKRE